MNPMSNTEVAIVKVKAKTHSLSHLQSWLWLWRHGSHTFAVSTGPLSYPDEPSFPALSVWNIPASFGFSLSASPSLPGRLFSGERGCGSG